MNPKLMLDPKDIEDVVVDGVAIGFNVKLRIPYYRGVCLSLIEDITIKYDNEVYPKEVLKFTTKDGTFTFDEMATMTTLRWEFGEKAIIFVPRKGGFYMARHRVKAIVAIRISYMGGARPISCVVTGSVAGD